MSILTKICVVVQTLLVLVACPVFISQATVAPNYRELYESKTSQNRALSQQVQQANTALEFAVAEVARQKTAAQAALGAQRTRVGELQADNALLEIKLANAQSSITSLEASLQMEQNLNQTANTRYDSQKAQGVKDRTQINALMEAANRRDVMLQDEQAKGKRLEMANRVQEEKIATLEQDNVRLKDIIANKGNEANGSQVAVIPDLVGTILAVREGVASINVGSARGVTAGMRLVVHRGEQFVGYLRIDQVSAQEAAGLLVDSKIQAIPGDKVFTQKEGV